MSARRRPPQYLTSQLDRQGRTVWYVRRKGRKIRLPAGPGSIGFEAAYLSALNEIGAEHPDIAAQRLNLPQPIRTTKPGYIYFLAFQGSVKIGFSTNPMSRIATLQTSLSGPPEAIVLVLGTNQDERALHQRFAKLKKSGEWFKGGIELRRAMSRAAGGGSVLHALEV